ncbi:hypothetical protein AB0H77_07470 [Streptomyces sp. NPDC050844]|uniref:hypothetical protein n=1 Tax=Streptomyces sp. NPDC050844 TaxID=3155790 RepID=UPI0033E0E1DB
MTGARNQPEDASAASTDGDFDGIGDLGELGDLDGAASPGPWYVRQLDDDHAMSLVAVSTVPDKGGRRVGPALTRAGRHRPARGSSQMDAFAALTDGDFDGIGELGELGDLDGAATPGPWHVRQLDDDHAMSLVAVSTVPDKGASRVGPALTRAGRHRPARGSSPMDASAPLTDDDLDGIAEIAAAATPGPWHVRQLDDDHAMSLVAVSTVPDTGRAERWPDFDHGEIVAATLVQRPRYVDAADGRWDENARCIARAREDVPPRRRGPPPAPTARSRRPPTGRRSVRRLLITRPPAPHCADPPAPRPARPPGPSW